MTDSAGDPARSPASPTAVDPRTPDASDTERQMASLAQRALDGGFEATVREIMERGLASDSKPSQTIRTLADMLSRFLGDWDLASLFLGLLASTPSETDESLTYGPIEDRDSRENLRLLAARLSALYGAEIRVGYDMVTRHADDWQETDIRSVYDLSEQAWTMDVTLRHLDNRTSHLAGPPISILRLVNLLLEQIRDLGDFDAPSLALIQDDEAGGDFIELATDLVDRITSQNPDREV